MTPPSTPLTVVDQPMSGEEAFRSSLAICLGKLMVAHNALADVGAAIRELRLADGYAARTGDESRFDHALSDICRHEERIKLILAKHAVAESETPNG